MNILKKLLPISIILFFSYWAIAPFFIPGFFYVHDDTQVARVFSMHKALSDGMFPVRWVSDLGYGYGYPIFNFYAPLAYYVGGFLNFATDSLTATKIMMVLGVLLSGVFMYMFAQALWGRVGGIVSALLYIYAPYHALNVYVRGDVGEFWAYAFVPLAFWVVYKLNQESRIRNQGLYSLIQRKIWLWIAMGSVAYAAIILSHNLTAMMVTPFLIAFALVLLFVSKQKKQFVLGFFCSFILALLLSAFYWLPVLPELRYTDVLSQIGGGADYKLHFVCANQLWDSPWGYGGSTFTCIDGLSFKIGKVHIVLAVLFVFLMLIQRFILHKKINQNLLLISLFSFISLVLSIFFMGEESKFIWDSIPPMAFFQYPWRFLLMVSFFISLLGGGVLMCLPRTNLVWVRWVLGGGIIALIIFVNAEVFVPQTIFQRTAQDYTNSYALGWYASHLTDEYLPPGFYNPKRAQDIPIKKIVIPTEAGRVTFFREKTQKIFATVVTKKPSDILIQQAYFPAWHVFLDGKEIFYKKTKKGMLVSIPEGKHTLELRFLQTSTEQLGNTLSLAGILVLILGIIVSRKDFTHAKKTT